MRGVALPEYLEVTIQSVDSLGRGVAFLPDGSIVVVEGGLPGQRVKAKVKFATLVMGRRVIIATRV